MVESQKNLLLIRVDKIGDLILTLNVDQAISAKEYKTHWLVNESLKWVTDSSVIQRDVFNINPKFTWGSLIKLVSLLIKLKVKTVIIFYAPTWIIFACWLARVPLRVGRKSKFGSFLFLNKGLRQKRSKSEMHESEYNLELVKFALGHPVIDPGPLKLTALKPSIGSSPAELTKLINSKKPFVVIHPGMAGSALNWPTDFYLELYKRVCGIVLPVITGTENDLQILEQIKALLSQELAQEKVLDLSLKLSGHELIFLLSEAKAVVAPSTGVAHLSASLGRPTIGLYSPIKEHLAKRWGPKGDKVVVFQPSQPNSPMSEISVEQVFQMIKRFL